MGNDNQSAAGKQTGATKKPYSTPTLVKHGDVRDITRMTKSFGLYDMGAQQHINDIPGSS